LRPRARAAARPTGRTRQSSHGAARLSRFGEAPETYRRLLALSPDWAHAAGWRLHMQLWLIVVP